VPATDLINIEANEGVDYSGDLRILATSKFGLRHIIQSLARHPPTSKAKLKFYVSESRGIHYARTVFALMCLLPRKDELLTEDEMLRNAEAAIHLTYSAFLTDDVVNFLQMRVVPMLGSGDVAWGCNRFTVKYPGTNLTLRLTPEALRHLGNHVNCSPPGGGCPKAYLGQCILRRRVDFDLSCEQATNAYERMCPQRRAGWLRWSNHGVLTPHLHSIANHSKPNPYVRRGMKGSAFIGRC
jgi:hypothetical protein